MVIGHRTAAGWLLDTWGSVPGSVKADTWYDILVQINGTTVTVDHQRHAAITYTFAPRMINGEPCR